MLRSHGCYRPLDPGESGRQAAYRELFRYQIDPGLVDEIPEATKGNYALGSSRFQDPVAKALGRRMIRLSQPEWQAVCDLVVQGMKNGRAAEGLAQAIRKSGELLADQCRAGSTPRPPPLARPPGPAPPKSDDWPANGPLPLT